jgi:sigma-B regulation protein RsbU (phosphoserine phosphatase)
MIVANRELLLYQERAEADLRAASVIQESLIPCKSAVARIAEVDVAWRFSPCHSIGGDVFNVVRLDEHRVGVYVLDVSGHGVPSAMVTVSVSQQLYPHAGILKEIAELPKAYRVAEPNEVLARLDEEFPMERFGKYFTMAYSVLDVRDGSLKSARAAHPPSYVLRRGGGLEAIRPVGKRSWGWAASCRSRRTSAG